MDLSKLTNYAVSHVDWVKRALSDNGNPSSSRLFGALSTVAAIFCLLFVTVKNHAAPDALTTGGLAAFGTAPYTVNRITGMFGGQKTDQDGGNADKAALVAVAADATKTNGDKADMVASVAAAVKEK